MAGLNPLINPGSIQGPQLSPASELAPNQAPGSSAQSAPRQYNSDSASLLGGGPSYMQTIEALILSQVGGLISPPPANLNAGNVTPARPSSTTRQNTVDPQTSGANNGSGIFSPANFMSPMVTGRNG